MVFGSVIAVKLLFFSLQVAGEIIDLLNGTIFDGSAEKIAV